MKRNEELVEQIYMEYKTNPKKTLRSLGKKYNLCFDTIKDWLINKPDYKQLVQTKLDNKKKIRDEDRQYICDLYQQGMTIISLAEEFNVSKRAIEKILIANNIPRRRPGKLSMVLKKATIKDNIFALPEELM